jgi:imidazolonepropionase-like amidohydrolase
MPENLMRFWPPNEHSYDLTVEERLLKNSQLQRYLDIVGAMHREGVEILAGTDSPNPFSFPGFGLHDELKLLVKAGFSPLEALQSATRDSARFMGLLDSYGTVDKGKVADLVLLDAGPTKDINNIDKITAVVIGGRLYAEQLLQQILQDSGATR